MRRVGSYSCNQSSLQLYTSRKVYNVFQSYLIKFQNTRRQFEIITRRELFDILAT
jgi:hypothetical protein